MIFEELIRGDKTEAHREEYYIYDHLASRPSLAPYIYVDTGIIVSYNYVIGGACLKMDGVSLLPLLMDDGRVALVLPPEEGEAFH